MFRTGKVLKVKVELAPNVIGFCRAIIVGAEGGHIFLQLKIGKDKKRVLPKGTRVWLVSDSIDNPFNGLWSTTVLGTRLVGGKTSFECARPKFEASAQKRKQQRVGVSYPVRLHGESFESLQPNTRNLSASGFGIEIAEDCSDIFVSGHYIDGSIDTNIGAVAFSARVINPRYNWLANRTDIGLEFTKLEPTAAELLERLLGSLVGAPNSAPDAKETHGNVEPGRLSGWLKTSRDAVKFIRAPETQTKNLLFEEDLDKLISNTEDTDSNADESFE